MTLFWFLICKLFQLFFLGLQFTFQFFNSHFPVTTLRLDLYSGTYLNKLLLVWCLGKENNSIYAVHQVKCFLAGSQDVTLL